ncbi:PadR family transcriptional regulator [Metabacillus indicus]|uniref:PadR family transcriptional regulator n=2 Tax=Metabacillus TaxID=2675233 RepID=A0A084H065_METID|nr:PadR family transcriptional regulator [Metabacillus indicus LMG 22858]KEZ52977.1 PadR family transcriptional regulator [Metabacillus indicus]
MPRNAMMEMEQLTDPAYYIVLSLLEEKHGYLIMKHIEELTGGEFIIGPATLYTLTKKLLDAEMISLSASQDDRRKVYKATEKGRKLLELEIGRRQRMAAHGMDAFKKNKEV